MNSSPGDILPHLQANSERYYENLLKSAYMKFAKLVFSLHSCGWHIYLVCPLPFTSKTTTDRLKTSACKSG